MADKQLNEGSKVPSITVMLIGTVIGLLSFFTILTVMVVNIYESKSEAQAEDDATREARLRKLRQEDQQALTSYELIDKEKDVWRIPVDQAKEKLLKQQGQTGTND